MEPWEIVEYLGETLVFFGVVGEVFAEWKEPERKKLARLSSVVLVIGLGVSLAALFATNKGFNDKIAELNNQAAGFNQKAAASELEAADARKETEQLSKNEQALKTRADEAELELARITGPIYLVPVIHGVASPDPTKGNRQRVVLTGDTCINLPRLPLGESISWTLFVAQDGVGQHQFKLFPELLSGNILSNPPHSAWALTLVTDSSGTVMPTLATFIPASPAPPPTNK